MGYLDNEGIDWSMRARERALQREAFEANQHAARAAGPLGSYDGYTSALQNSMAYGPAAAQAQAYASRANFNSGEASGDSEYAARAQSAAREGNLMKHEAARRQFDSETGRYQAETARHDSDNQLKAQMGHIGALNNMSSQMGNMFGGGGGQQSAPGINLYGAGGQRIGGSGMSPLRSLLS
jgi:hypothetical protein